jgi:LacI family transcriptional regulator
LARPRIQDIADVAGVSPATVSRVINNRPMVSDIKRDLVIDALRSLGGGVMTKTLVGLVLPDSGNPFFTDLAFRLQAELQSKNLHLLIASSEGRLDREASLIEQFKAIGVDGLVYIGVHEHSEALIGLVSEGRLPVVVLDRRVQSGNLDSVVSNADVATRAAVALLKTRGHSKVGYVHGLLETETGRERLECFRNAMQHNDLHVREQDVFPGDFSLSSGRSAASLLNQRDPSERPTALVVANDLMAIGLIQHLEENGWRLPEQLSVIGFDDIQWSAACFPALTTIQQPIARLVAETSRILLMRLGEYEKGFHSISRSRVSQFDCTLIVRNSVSSPTG